MKTNNQFYSHYDNDQEDTENRPLVNSAIPSPNGLKTRQRRYKDTPDEEHNVPNTTNAVFKSSSFSPPPEYPQQSNNNNTGKKRLLQSLTFGGLGPADQNTDMDNNNSKSKPNKITLTSMHQSITSCLQTCGCSNHAMVSTEGPTQNFYRDDFNDQPFACTIGTTDEDGIWMNRSDSPGTIMAFMVWVLLGYSAITITFLAETGGIPSTLAMAYVVCCSLALASHAKTQFTDPGSVPPSAQPIESLRRNRDNYNNNTTLIQCSQCQTFKPPFAHHCRICNRCVSRMDHHCPWMNNCIGAGNLKHFILFLVYTWLCNVMALMLLGWNYFFCESEECVFSTVLIQLTRIMTVLATGALLFTSSMIMNVIYGIISGIGTIDRLKKKATDTMFLSDEEPIPLKDVFGIAGFHTWIIPVDPVFEDFDRVMGYSTSQRLLREEMKHV